MKFICFGYLDVEAGSRKSEKEQHEAIDACLAYDEGLKKNGHWAGGEGLSGTAATLRYQDGQVRRTDGPFAETKEFLGGLLLLEAQDMNQAVELISKHPGMRMGPWEIRQAEDLTPMIQESERRRGMAPRRS